jgi:NAD(P)-dependent dehydrogenase (short-subunit alcohol dehydrogenase family)
MGKYLCQVFSILAHRSSRFAAYSASKAALNQAMRHMAAELKRKDDDTILIAIHPGEVATYVHSLDDEDETYADESRQGHGKY